MMVDYCQTSLMRYICQVESQILTLATLQVPIWYTSTATGVLTPLRVAECLA